MQLAPFPAPARKYPNGSQRHRRMLLTVPLMLHYLVPGGVRFTQGISLDISEGGLGALVKGELRVGDTVSLELRLSDADLKAVAIVRHSLSGRSGFEFLGLTPDEKHQIARLVGTA